MALPTAATPGYGYYPTVTSHPDVACNCLREWLPVLQRLARYRGILGATEQLAAIQCTGGASASAGTHSRGGAYDLRLPDPTRWHDATRRDYRVCGPKTLALLKIAREMGAQATWPRIDVDGRADGDAWENNEHLHGVLRNCPHNEPARYQIDEYDRGEDGLTGSGRDTYYRPRTVRTWQQGISWAKAQMGTTTTTTTRDWFDMADKADLQSVVRAELERPEFLREVARYVLTGYAFDHDNDTSTPKAVLAYAIQDMADEVWDEKPGDNPNPLWAHVLNANVVATQASRGVTAIQNDLAAIKKKLGI